MRLFRRGEQASTLDLLVAGLESRSGARPRSSQRRLDGRRGARPAPRRLVPLEVQRESCGDASRGRPGGVAAARDVHERVGPLDLVGCALLQGRARGRPRCSRRRRSPEWDDLQARLGGGLAGHNGLRSIAQVLGTPGFIRLRVGVGRPERGHRRPVADYVLSPFEADEDVEEIVSRAADAPIERAGRWLDGHLGVSLSWISLRRNRLEAVTPP